MTEITKHQSNDLAKSKSITSSLIKISKPTDILKAKPIKAQIKEYGEEPVLISIRMFLEKCVISLGIKMTNERISLLCEDVLEVYGYESLEDIRECLKKARNGSYSFGHESRNTISMIHIRKWMTEYLEKKVELREKQHNEIKKQSQEKHSEIDYDKYKKRLKEEKEKKQSRPSAFNQENYKKMLNDYQNKKKNE